MTSSAPPPSSGRSVIDNASMGDSLLDQSYCNLTIIEPLLGELNSKGTSLLPLAWTALKTAFWRVLAKTESFVPGSSSWYGSGTSTVAQVAAPATVEENVSGQNSMDISTSGFVLEPSLVTGESGSTRTKRVPGSVESETSVKEEPKPSESGFARRSMVRSMAVHPGSVHPCSPILSDDPSGRRTEEAPARTRQWDGSQNTMIRAPAVEEGDSATGGHHDRTIAR